MTHFATADTKGLFYPVFMAVMFFFLIIFKITFKTTQCTKTKLSRLSFFFIFYHLKKKNPVEYNYTDQRSPD